MSVLLPAGGGADNPLVNPKKQDVRIPVWRHCCLWWDDEMWWCDEMWCWPGCVQPARGSRWQHFLSVWHPKPASTGPSVLYTSCIKAPKGGDAAPSSSSTCSIHLGRVTKKSKAMSVPPLPTPSTGKSGFLTLRNTFFPYYTFTFCLFFPCKAVVPEQASAYQEFHWRI